MRWVIENAINNFENRADSWQRIVDENYSSTPGLSTPFVRLLIRHYADSDTILATASDSGTSIAHILLERTGIGRWATFNPPQSILGLAIFSRYSQNKETLMASLTRVLPGYCLQLTVKKQDPDMTQWADNSDLVEITPRNTTMSIALDGTFDDYWNNRKKKLTRNIRRYLKRLDRTSAKVTLEILTKHEDVVAAVAEYGMLESTGWKGKQGTSIHPDSKDGLFYQELFSEFSKLSNAKIYRLRLNNSVIASRLLVYHNGIMVSLKITYDEDFAEFAPGRVLLYLFLKDAFKQRDVQKIEFYTHANIDQLQWSTGRKSMYQVIIYRYSYYRRPLAVTRSIKNILLKRKSQLLVMIFSNRYLESLTPNIASKFTQHHSRH